jgi:hypothetical protein
MNGIRWCEACDGEIIVIEGCDEDDEPGRIVMSRDQALKLAYAFSKDLTYE